MVSEKVGKKIKIVSGSACLRWLLLQVLCRGELKNLVIPTEDFVCHCVVASIFDFV